MDDEGNEKSQLKSLDYLNMSSTYGSVTCHDVLVVSRSVKVISCKNSEIYSSLAEAY